jgi:alpha-glucosidase
MRAGFTGSQKYCTLLWAGDQSVDFSRHDGLCTTICAALSSGMSGCGLNHSDIGGYTSLFGNTRTKEVFLRWAEMAAFTPVMRTHEGNRPDTNFQYYDDDECMDRLSRLTKLHVALRPLLKDLVKENAEKGLPVMRPLFLHNEADPRCLTEQFEYLLGPDVLVAPVWQAGQSEREVYLPEGSWVHLWTGKTYGKGEHTVPAPLGDTPVFYRADSCRAEMMEGLRARFGA